MHNRAVRNHTPRATRVARVPHRKTTRLNTRSTRSHTRPSISRQFSAIPANTISFNSRPSLTPLTSSLAPLTRASSNLHPLLTPSYALFSTSRPQRQHPVISFRWTEQTEPFPIEFDPDAPSIMQMAIDQDIPIEAACGGELSCCSCHGILTKEVFDTLPAPDDEELDLLDCSPECSSTSRLLCQIQPSDVKKDMDIYLPLTV